MGLSIKSLIRDKYKTARVVRWSDTVKNTNGKSEHTDRLEESE